MNPLDEAAAALADGLVVVLPTDTVYGVAVDPSRPGATERLFALKERPHEVALPVLVAGVGQALALAADVPLAARRLMDRFWPGGLTIVLPRSEAAAAYDLGGPDDRTIGLRMPDHPVPLALAGRVGPLAVTSANRHRRPTPTTAEEVTAELGEGIAEVVDGGACTGLPSTVVGCTGDGVRILREGRIPAEEIFFT